MITKRITVNNNTVYKTYRAEFLLDPRETISDRITKINSLKYNEFTSLVKTNIVKKENKYKYTQEYTPSEKIFNIDKNQFKNLILALEHLSRVSLVHGDINRKNIIYTKNGFKIIDLEPSLNQVVDGIKKIMITKPYISKQDLIHRKISNRTDKIGFFYFILRITKKITVFDIVNISKDLDHKKIMGFNESELDNLTYTDLLNMAWDTNNDSRIRL